MRTPILVVATAATVALAACEGLQNQLVDPEVGPEPGLATSLGKKANDLGPGGGTSEMDAQILAFMETANIRLAAEGAEYRVGAADWIGFEMAGRVMAFSDRGNQQMDMHFVPRDPRRSWSGDPEEGNDDITWVVDQTEDAVPPGGTLTEAQTTAAITSAMATWEAIRCSDLELTQGLTWGFDVGFLAWEISGGAVGSPFVFADVQHAGWRDLNFPTGVLGVTFTYYFINPATDEPTDIDRDGRIDAAFREIYYDPSWIWVTSLNPAGPFDIDVESIAVHEMGHGLSQYHFGALFRTEANGRYHFAPKALMNAGYTGPQREILGSDMGGHCGIWASWPNN